MSRFPTRTILLMVAALIAFFFMQWQSRQLRARVDAERERSSTVTIVPFLPSPPVDGGAR